MMNNKTIEIEIEILSIGNYLLIDAAQASILVQDFENENKVSIINLFGLIEGKESDIPNKYSPLLIKITQQNKNSLTLLTQEIIGRRAQKCINIISTDLSLNQLSKQLSNFLIASDETESEYLLRFYDTEVLVTLLEILREEQTQSLFYKINEWYIYSNDSFINLAQAESYLEKEKLVSSITLTQQQFELLDSSIFRRILDDLKVGTREEYDELLKLAQDVYTNYGVNQIDDLELFLEIVYETNLHKNNLSPLLQIMANTSLSVETRLLEIEKL